MDQAERIESLLQAPYWVVDILPEQVPKDSPGQYFAVEKYFLSWPQIAAVKQKHIDLILKLNCYMDLSLDEEPEINPPPGEIAEAMRRRYVSILLKDAMIVSEPDDTCLTVYDPDEKTLRLLRILSAGEGLYVWQPET